MRITNNQRLVGEGAIFTVEDSFVGMSSYHFAFKIRYCIHEKLGPFPIGFSSTLPRLWALLCSVSYTVKKYSAHSKCFGSMAVGIVLYGLILSQSKQQTSGDAPNADFHHRSKVSFLVWGRFTMLLAAMMMILGAIVNMIVLILVLFWRVRIMEWVKLEWWYLKVQVDLTKSDSVSKSWVMTSEGPESCW